MSVPSKLSKLGFCEPSPKPPRRLIVSVQAATGCGKTNFAFTAPGPIAYFPIDVGEEHVVQKFTSTGKKIFHWDRCSMPNRGHMKQDSAEYKTACLKLWEDLHATYYAALESGEARTLAVDTFTEAYQLQRLGRFGKLTQVMPENYYPLQEELRTMIRAAYDSDVNLILLHKISKQYVKEKGEKRGEWNGEWELAGFSDTPYNAQVAVELFGPPHRSDFGFRILKCRQNPDVVGVECEGREMTNFATLATLVFPDSIEDDWQ